MPDDLLPRLKKAYELHQAGQADAARAAYQVILELDPQQPEANNLMGLLCIQAGESLKAARYIRRALRRDPSNPQSHYNLGLSLANQGRMQEAAEAFGAAVALNGDNPDYRSAHGNALRLAGDARAAAGILEDALRKASGHGGLRLNLSLAQNDLGAASVRRGEHAQAVRHFLRAVELNPSHARAHMNLGLTLEQLGRIDEAVRHYKLAITAKPDFADAHFQLAHLRTRTSSRDEIEAMQRLFEWPATAHEDKVRLAFGLGMALESNRRFAEAFSFMQRGHELQSRKAPFDIDSVARQFQRIQNVFSMQRLASPEASGPGGQHPVMIVGMPRSGTTLAEQILASHPQVKGKGESMGLAQAVQLLGRGQPYPDGHAQLCDDDLVSAAGEYLKTLEGETNDRCRLTDTTPMNFRFVGLAAMMLPKACFVFCVRNPMDNCLSLYRQMLTGANRYAHRLENLGRYYNLHLKLLEHWESALPGRIFRLQYEDLVRDNEAQVRRLLSFCDLPYDPACLRFYEAERAVRSPSAALVRQPFYDTSIGSWKNYERELEPLRQALRRD